MNIRIEKSESPQRPDSSYRHGWQEGDLVTWNNSAEMHRVAPCDEYCGRTMHRATIMGTERLGGPLAVQRQ